MKLVLCSSSPRRLELLQQAGLDPEVIPSQFIENIPKADLTPQQYIQQTSLGKLNYVRDNYTLTKSLLISADTVVVCEGTIYEKPGTKEANLQMLTKFSDVGYVEVMTSVDVFNTETNDHKSFVEVTKCFLANWLTQRDLNDYVDTLEGLQVAGGFKIQGKGALLFDKIEGDYFNIVGLPLAKAAKVIKDQLQNL